MELLSSAAVAVVLDSSVVVDCRLAGVPCLSVGWYPGNYGEELARLDYVTRARSPEHLNQLVTRILDGAVC
jgi:hypothetical protein